MLCLHSLIHAPLMKGNTFQSGFMKRRTTRRSASRVRRLLGSLPSPASHLRSRLCSLRKSSTRACQSIMSISFAAMMCCCFHTALADQRSMRPRACAHIDIQSHTGIVFENMHALGAKLRKLQCKRKYARRPERLWLRKYASCDKYRTRFTNSPPQTRDSRVPILFSFFAFVPG